MGKKKLTLTTQKSSMESPDGNIKSMQWNDKTGEEDKKPNYYKNKQGCMSAFNYSLITTQSMRLNQRSSCKVFGMLQNKHWVSGSVSTFGCHLIQSHPPCTQATLEFSPPIAPPLALHSDHLSKKILTLAGTDHNVRRRKGPTVTSQLFFPKLCGHLVGSHSWDFQTWLPPRHGHYEGWTCARLLK